MDLPVVTAGQVCPLSQKGVSQGSALVVLTAGNGYTDMNNKKKLAFMLHGLRVVWKLIKYRGKENRRCILDLIQGNIVSDQIQTGALFCFSHFH